MANLSFTFDKPYDEVDINGTSYKLYFDDESLRVYRKQAERYQKDVDDYLTKQAEVETMTEEELAISEEKGIEFAKDFIETFCGKGSFDTLYESSGKSMLNFMPLIEYIFTWLNGKIPDVDTKNSKKDHYIKKSKR